MGIFDLLELAGEESGEEAVAKVAKEVVPRSLSKQEKKQLYELKKRQQQPQQQLDGDEGQEYSGEGGGLGGGQGLTGGGPLYAGGMGRPNGRILVDADGNRHRDYSRDGDNGNTGYRGNFNGNARGRGNFSGNRGYNNGGVGRGYGNGGYNNGNRGYNNNGYSNGNGDDNQVYHEGNGQYQQDGNNYSNGARQGHIGDGKPRMEYRPKSKPSSVAVSDADQKSEEKVEPVAKEVSQKEASAENVDAVPASESENSSGDAAKDDSKKVDVAENVPKKPRDPNVKLLSGSAKRKLKKASKKTTGSFPEVIEEEKQEMTLEEYEKMLEKKKSSVPSEPVERKMDPAFEGLKPLEKKKLEDEVKTKLKNAQRKGKELAANEGKAHKLHKPPDGKEYFRDGPQSSGYSGGLGDGRDSRMDHGLPEPDITIEIEENSVDPFGRAERELRLWLANHAHSEDLLENANSEIFPDYDELMPLGHPLLEGQTKKEPPRRWLHLKLQLAKHKDNWLRLVLRADNCYVKGFGTRPDHLPLTCYELMEQDQQGQEDDQQGQEDDERRKMLSKYKSVGLPWDVKYHLLLGCDDEEFVIAQRMKEMGDDPVFMTEAIKYFSFFNPAVGNQKEAKRILAGIIFKLCEFLRMRMTFDEPRIMQKVWHWRDICLKLRKWRRNGYKGWDGQFKVIGIMGPRDALLMIKLVLNETYWALLSADAYKAKMEKRLRSSNNESNAAQKKRGNAFSGTKNEIKPSDSGSKPSDSASKPSDYGSKPSDSGSKGGTINFRSNTLQLPLGRRRVQLLSIKSNFKVDAMYVYDSHRIQTIHARNCGYICKEADVTNWLLCGPRRAIGGYGYFGINVYPSQSVTEQVTKSRTIGRGECECVSDSWDVSIYDDAEPSRHTVTFCGNSGRRVAVSYLLIPNAVEAQLKVQFYFAKNCQVYGFIKATAKAFQRNCVEIFRRENQKPLSVSSHNWSLPMLVDLFLLPNTASPDFSLEIDLEVAEPGKSATRIRASCPFTSKLHQYEFLIDNEKKIQISVRIRPSCDAESAKEVGA